MKKQTFLTQFKEREYFLSMVEGYQPSGVSTAIVKLNSTVDDDSPEFMFALNDIIEQIIALPVGRSMYFQPIRDDANSKGIILRTK